MPTGSNWIKFLFVTVGFLAYGFLVVYYLNLAEIRKNWPLYRCNPMYMMFAENIEQNFTQCIQASQMNFMGYILQPMEYVTSSLSSGLGAFSEELNSVRAMFSKTRDLLSSTVTGVFGAFINIVIEFQKITIATKDTFGKFIGILATLIYIISGSVMTINSAVKSPPMMALKKMGKCFHPETKLQLADGTFKEIQHMNTNDQLLKDNAFINCVMVLDNSREKELFYELNGVLVTGSHLVFNGASWVHVRDHNDATLRPDIKTDKLYCLITSTHRIWINNLEFHDWEDHYLV